MVRKKASGRYEWNDVTCKEKSLFSRPFGTNFMLYKSFQHEEKTMIHQSISELLITFFIGFVPYLIVLGIAIFLII
jgi:hypothetical protein